MVFSCPMRILPPAGFLSKGSCLLPKFIVLTDFTSGDRSRIEIMLFNY